MLKDTSNKKQNIVIEGVCSIGKTTAFNPICQHFPGKIVPEGVRFIESPPPAPTCLEEAIRNDFFFLDVDFRRSLYASELCAEGNHVLMERDILGCLSISFGYYTRYQTYPNTARELVRFIKERHYSPPTAYIWFKAPVASLSGRSNGTKRHVSGPGLTDIDAISRQAHFLDEAFAVIQRHIPVYIVTADQSKEAVQNDVQAILDRILTNYDEHVVSKDLYLTDFCNFLHLSAIDLLQNSSPEEIRSYV